MGANRPCTAECPLLTMALPEADLISSPASSQDSNDPGVLLGETESVLQPNSAPGPIDRTKRSGNCADIPAPRDLKRKTARAALVSTVSQGVNFVLRMSAMVVLARLLNPADFGLVGMATACTGFLELFRDAGLSQATIQRASITSDQTSTLFWINVAVGAILAMLSSLIAPILTAFYHEPRLLWVTVVIGMGFLFGGASAQHRAVLMRNMRFATLAVIDIGSLSVSIGVGVGMALAGQGYWALVGMSVCGSVMNTFGVWIASGWIPGPPQRRAGVRSMLKYGSTLTLNSVLTYIAYNADKVLLGRFWGAEALGIYGRAYQFITLPTSNLNTCIGQVAFPALSRLQDDPERLRSYFLKGYGLFLSIVMPITMACALFAEDIIRVFLGPNWGEAAPVFRLLAPSILAMALINPFGWFMQAIGQAVRSFRIALLFLPVVIVGYVAGLRYGANGVAAGFSVVAVILVGPVIFWARHGTSVSMIDTLRSIIPPFVSVLIGTAAALAAWPFVRLLEPPLLRLIAANTILFGVYGVALWFLMGQKGVYLGLLREIGIWPFPFLRKGRLSKVQVSE
jgi:O-antigen/teichoic acid export membrane protein